MDKRKEKRKLRRVDKEKLKIMHRSIHQNQKEIGQQRPRQVDRKMIEIEIRSHRLVEAEGVAHRVTGALHLGTTVRELAKTEKLQEGVEEEGVLAHHQLQGLLVTALC